MQAYTIRNILKLLINKGAVDLPHNDVALVAARAEAALAQVHDRPDGLGVADRLVQLEEDLHGDAGAQHDGAVQQAHYKHLYAYNGSIVVFTLFRTIRSTMLSAYLPCYP
jgi:hypothetical protein